ncbi:hypothetical protein [Chitinophaga rhizosphaerae]|uniref:hypothetical protein n=1 Tax=Chitinophaga rhizosphaerae TaxID=1864947 RepID=UPI000F7FBEAA|nr:hypothetical protein [Chitinophaga rhizosphaerae]
MKSFTLFGLLFLCLNSSAYSQQPVDALDPMTLEKNKDDLEKIKASIERSNTGPTIQDYSTSKEKTELDQLIESLEPGNGPHASSNPATTPIAPTGIYNTSDTSKINFDDEIFKSSNENNNNQGTLVVFSIVIISTLAIVVLILKLK